jgi:hypothetical protein
MNFISKQPGNEKNFWVENYTAEEKAFFLGLGFTETDNSHVPKAFGIRSTLQIRGTGPFGFWTEEERINITTAITVRFGIRVKIEEHNPYE